MLSWLSPLIRLLRPRHWVKNSMVVLPLLFARRMQEVDAWIHVTWAFAGFCAASSFAYIINDIRDREADRFHPVKSRRPLASGELKVGQAGLMAVVMFAAAVLASSQANPVLLIIVLLYILLQLAYTLRLKRLVLLDVMCIATGFVLRADAGAVAIGVPISPWLVACTFTVCLFMGFCKRQGELIAIADPELAAKHRAALAGYTPALLSQLVGISAAVTVMSYLGYTLSHATIERFGHDLMVYTLPVVTYAVFRFALLFLEGRYHDPTELILRDRPFQFAAGVWLAMTGVLVVWGGVIHQTLREWVGS